MEQRFGRLGIPMSRSTMTDLFHRAGELVAPLAYRIVQLIAASEIVLADETPMPVQDDRKKPYIWTFVSGTLVAYRFSMTRSGETPKAILGGTTGTLVVDMYTGYNAITGVEGRQRAGCLSHARRKFFKALNSAPEAKVALELSVVTKIDGLVVTFSDGQNGRSSSRSRASMASSAAAL
jgi:transposase